ncbi:hypothetical protein SLS60_011470 [Paraconiothyrium brasiliense]|uniref:Uncharacterized protein n=1 Tax=Paraconiothyrium brasiliense TaxID=300254 RepID=A0ABR3QJQ0_9PLEO
MPLDLTNSQHQPGKLVGNDAVPEFSAQTLPAGTAPASSTYTPNPDLNNQEMYQDASSTIGGATSADVHTGLGHPGSGQTSSELHGTKKRDRTGLTGLTSTMETNDKVTGKDPYFAHQRNLEDVPAGQRGNIGGPPAQERVPETADTVARESAS